MDRATIEPATKILLTEIHAKLSEATRIAKAAETCALAGASTNPTDDGNFCVVMIEKNRILFRVSAVPDSMSVATAREMVVRFGSDSEVAGLDQHGRSILRSGHHRATQACPQFASSTYHNV